MTELRNNRSYKTDLWQTWLILTVGMAIVAMLKPFDLWAFLIVFLFISIVLSGRIFTASIKVDPGSVQIKYHRFFLSKEVIVPSNEASLLVVKAVAFRGGEYYKLKVFRKNKLVYTIDGRDGFDKESLEIIAQSKKEQEAPPNDFITNG